MCPPSLFSLFFLGHLSVPAPVHPSVRLSVCQSVCLSVSASARMLAYLPISLPACLPACLSHRARGQTRSAGAQDTAAGVT